MLPIRRQQVLPWCWVHLPFFWYDKSLEYVYFVIKHSLHCLSKKKLNTDNLNFIYFSTISTIQSCQGSHVTKMVTWSKYHLHMTFTLFNESTLGFWWQPVCIAFWLFYNQSEVPITYSNQSAKFFASMATANMAICPHSYSSAQLSTPLATCTAFDSMATS